MSRLDAVVAAIPEPRRDALERRLAATSPLLPQVSGLLNADPDMCWVLAAWCRRALHGLPRYSDGRVDQLCDILRALVARVRELADGPEVWGELLAAVPNHKPQIAYALLATMPDTPHALAAIRRVLTTMVIPHRRLLATRLRASGTLEPALAVTWFADPTLRTIAEEYFTPGLEHHEPLLRKRIEIAKDGEREAIVRLLRRIDPTLTLSGTHDASTDGELQTRLRAAPDDATTAEVWADSLIDRQDPRGELIALELAILRADPERALELSRTQAALVTAHRKALWNKPGGFPFREKYRGRHAFAFASAWDHTMRGSRENILDRVQSFVETATDVRAPRTARARDRAVASKLAAALGGSVTQHRDREGTVLDRAATHEPIADLDALRELGLVEKVVLVYDFRLAWPNTGIALPHQEGAHYAGGEELRQRLEIALDASRLQLALTFPFESVGDSRLAELYEAMCDTLGRVFTPSRWLAVTPSADGKKLVRKRLRFSDPSRPQGRSIGE